MEVFGYILEILVDALLWKVHRQGPTEVSSSCCDELCSRLQSREKLEHLLQKKQKIAAIKLFREETGAGLKEAKECVERVQAQLHSAHSHSAHEKKQAEMPSIAYSMESHEEVVRLGLAGNKIHAIKLYRARTGASLREAKEMVDKMVIGRDIVNASVQQMHYVVDGQQKEGLVDTEELQRILHTGNKIAAIKYFRNSTGASLKEAKEAVEWLEESLRQH